MVPTQAKGVVGSCIPIFNSDGSIKDQFLERIVFPTVSTTKKTGVTFFSTEVYDVARQPERTTSAAQRFKIPISLSSTAISRIEALGASFRSQDLFTVSYKEGLQENVDFTVAYGLSAAKDSYDLTYTIMKANLQSLTAEITFNQNNYFFRHLPNLSPASRRLLQDFSNTNQNLVDQTPLISNMTFRATITAHNYDDWVIDTMMVLGVILRLVIFIAMIFIIVGMIVQIFRNPQPKIVPIAKFLEFVTSILLVVKIAFLPALYSTYELVFLDELAKVDTLFMGLIIEEGKIRSGLRITNKFGEYGIPVLVLNSAAMALVFLMVSLIAITTAKIVYTVRNQQNQGHNNQDTATTKKTGSAKHNNTNNKSQPQESSQPFLELVWMALALVIPTLFFYSVVGLTWNSMTGNTHYALSVTSMLIALGLVLVLSIGLVVGLLGYCLSLQKKGEEEGSVFELWNVWVSLLRSALLMTLILSLR